MDQKLQEETDTKFKAINVRLYDEDLREGLDKLAKEDGSNASVVMRRLLRRELVSNGFIADIKKPK